jgi:hypothetical protein
MDVAAVTLRAWAEAASPGERRVYFLGCLASTDSMQFLARAAYELYQTGKIDLLQSRIDERVFAYIAQRRTSPAASAATPTMASR